MEKSKKIKIRKGLDLPLKGKPEQQVRREVFTRRVAVNGNDYADLKPRLKVKVGDRVKKGDVLFVSKRHEKIGFTSPAAGKVVEINRGYRRILESVVVEVSGTDERQFSSFTKEEIRELSRDKVREELWSSGLWTGLRQRPYDRVADPVEIPHSIFVTVIDTNPLAPSARALLEGNDDSFQTGVLALSKLTDGTTYICKSRDAGLWDFNSPKIKVVEFTGPHPAGNPGTHIHFLDPVSRRKTVWHIGLQDVIAIGKFLVTGKIPVERIVALGGSGAASPKLLRTTIGADVTQICTGELIKDEALRIVSGSVLNGRQVEGHNRYLGRYHQQIVVLKRDLKKRFLGWLGVGFKTYSTKNLFLSKYLLKKEYEFDTDQHGGVRNIYPTGDYEGIMPMDILPTFLLRSLMIGDIEEAEKLGILELAEEDLSLCTFISPAKIDYGRVLRENLVRLEKEG